MRNTIQALVWEQVYRNRVVFPVWALLLGVGWVLTVLLAGADREAWWFRPAAQGLLVAFLASVLVGYAPFSLMESREGWRMNSMVTRWFVLPVRTGVLVLVPYLAACLTLGVFMGMWLALFRRLDAGLDTGYVGLVLMLGLAAMQAWAWVVPRRPSQFWPVVLVGFPVLLLVMVMPLDNAGSEPFRERMRTVAPIGVTLLGMAAYAAARLNRSGVWGGELPLAGLGSILFRGRLGMPRVRSSRAAMFWSDALPVWRTFLLSWLGVFLVVWGSQVLMAWWHPRARGMSWGMLVQVGLVLMPWLGVMWLPVGGLFLGAEPGTGFRTRQTSFRAMLPVTAGTVAGQRVLAALGMWGAVWVPWLMGLPLFRLWHPGLAEMDLPAIYASSGRLMALSAHALIGALPLLLWGRFEGFPNMLLVAMCAWACTWILGANLNLEGDPGWRWAVVLGLLAFKWGAGGYAIWRACRSGHVTWRYGVGIAVGWMVVVGLMIRGLPTWSVGGWWGAVSMAVLVPFARLACAPLAVAANRHR
jgi:hypothetical protein